MGDSCLRVLALSTLWPWEGKERREAGDEGACSC